MKTRMLVLLVILFQINLIKGQVHPTINDVKVGYKPVVNTGSVLPSAYMQCAPVATITLKSNINASKIYLKVLDKTSNASLYEINYSLAIDPVYNQNGDLIFKKEGNVVIIRSNVVLNLKPYLFEIATEDNNNVKTENYTTIK